MAEPSAKAMSRSLPKITVHWLERSRSQRLLWLLEECHLPYDVKVYKRVGGAAPPELKQIHPLGKAPVLTIITAQRESPLVLAESGTIFEYLVDHYAPRLAPKQYKDGSDGDEQIETDNWLRYRYYMHYTEGSLMSLLMREHTLQPLHGPEVDRVSSKLGRDLKTHLDFVESQIKSSPDSGLYICGRDMTAADIMLAFPLMVIQSSPGGLSGHPKLEEYVNRLKDMPSYRASIKRAEEQSGEKYSVV